MCWIFEHFCNIICDKCESTDALPCQAWVMLCMAGMAGNTVAMLISARRRCTRCSYRSVFFFIYHLHSTLPLILINVKNFHGSLTTVVRARNDTSKTANITFSILHGMGSRSIERFCVQRRNIKKLSGNFGYMGRSNSWGDLGQMRLVGRYRWRNHVCNISWLSVKGCGCGERGNFAFSHWLDVSPLQCRVTVW